MSRPDRRAAENAEPALHWPDESNDEERAGNRSKDAGGEIERRDDRNGGDEAKEGEKWSIVGHGAGWTRRHRSSNEGTDFYS